MYNYFLNEKIEKEKQEKIMNKEKMKQKEIKRKSKPYIYKKNILFKRKNENISR